VLVAWRICGLPSAEDVKMEPQFVERDALVVMGVQSREPYQTDDFGPIWQEFETHHREIEAHSTDGAFYGVNFDDGGVTEYLAGMAVEGVEEAPGGLTVRDVPGGGYAVFECTVSTIHDAYEHICHKWLPASEHQQDPSRPCFERYPPDTTTGESPVLIHIPVMG
jgi:predicted transcriptional regulator YdeE